MQEIFHKNKPGTALRIEFMLSHGHNKDATERKEIAYLR
jgi:hypothetical protein